MTFHKPPPPVFGLEPPFEIDEKHCNAFDEADPYNSQNIVRGFVNKRQGWHYGTLYITHVNGIECSQVIPSAPKQHYPFDSKGRWEWPDYDHVEIYEKLDGTCIIGYSYYNADGNNFQTYKTRLRPFLGEGAYGNFKKLWDEVLEKYPGIVRLQQIYPPWVFVYELYGKRNHHLIDYDTPLDTKFLFARMGNHPDYMEEWFIETPSQWASSFIDTLQDIGVPYLEEQFRYAEVNQEVYQEMREWVEDQCVTMSVPISDDDEELPTDIGNIEGMEGQVWYFMKNDRAEQIKCKPEQVLKYHWNAVGRDGKPKIPFLSLYTTVVNAFENTDEPDFEFVKQLLMEEYPEEMCDRAHARIEKTLKQVKFDKQITHEILEKYEEVRSDAFNLTSMRGPVMQLMAKEFCDSKLDRKRMASKIFNVLVVYEKGMEGEDVRDEA